MHGNFKESLQISVVYFLIEYFYEGESMRILLAEDDEELNRALCFQLKAQGFSVDTCLDGEEALFYGEQNIYDVILLDRMLPHMEGTAVLSRLRKKGVLAPVILITALGTLTDKVIHCVARRPRTLENTRNISFLDLTFYPEEYRLSGPSGSCTLSRREAALMETFLRRKEQPLSRSSLLLTVWGPDSDVEEGNLDNYIHFLRRRLTTVGSSLSIKTLRGFGYCLKKK